MAVWSSFAFKNIVKNVSVARRAIVSFKNAPKIKAVAYIPVRNSHDRTIVIRNSTFEMFKFKDLFYFYLAIGALPLLAVILYCNIFIGPATLALIPEGYDPKPWEYYPHPITRFFAKYIVPSKQEAYERTLHNLCIDNELKMLRKLDQKVKALIKERGDYQSWYFEKPQVKYTRRMKDLSERSEQKAGKSGGWIF